MAATNMKGFSVGEPETKGPAWETKENPQAYDQNPFFYVHYKPARTMLGTVGGNDVSLVKGNQVDVESDLRRLNIPNTFCPERAYQAPKEADPKKIIRDNVKTKQTIDITLQHLQAQQMWAYPATIGPEPLKVDHCGTPERF
jgi:hypothetical protein